MTATFKKALAVKAANKAETRRQAKTERCKRKKVVHEIVKQALKEQEVKMKEAVKRRKLRYDSENRFDSHAIRNDAAMYKKKYLASVKAATIAQAKEKELEDWRMFWKWVEAHGHPPTVKWLRRLKKNGPPPAPDRLQIG